ncbi:MAG TPA: PP2C family serine/threonine-protein phosphatase [Gemmatimonadales bacterium]|nr:PP2C family serine/threonine-protein phosphatase [Gemmatimonadales bacterium]
MARSPTPPAGTPAVSNPPKPRDEDLDFFGCTHKGLVRKQNEDNFLLCSLHKTMKVISTSLPNPELLELPSQRLASFSMVADGVGGHSGGETASRAALEAVADYVTHAMECFYRADPRQESVFLEALRGAAMESHAAVKRRAEEAGGPPGMSTTLTLAIGVWPMLYILQVGDSRLYRLRNGVLEQLTRDQTVAEDLVDQGVLPRANVFRSPFAHVLSSSIGGHTNPMVTGLEIAPGDVTMLCTDGLTKHVSDERIRERLSNVTSSEQACKALVQDALDGGGTDNVTVVVLRANRPPG